MTKFYIPPATIPGGIPPASLDEDARMRHEIRGLVALVKKQHEMLMRLEWSDVGKAFSAAYGGDITVHRCPVCNRSREHYGGQHAEDCKLAALIRGDQ